MAAYIVRRLVWAVFVVLLVTLLTFLIFYLLPPGDPALRFAGKSPTEETIAADPRAFGLDEPWYEQYGHLRQEPRHRRRVGLARARLLVRHAGLRS